MKFDVLKSSVQGMFGDGVENLQRNSKVLGIYQDGREGNRDKT
jgi:hypothetical protein